MFIGWNQWSKLRRFGESRQSFMAAQREFSDNVCLQQILWLSQINLLTETSFFAVASNAHCQKILSARPRTIGATPKNRATLITDFSH